MRPVTRPAGPVVAWVVASVLVVACSAPLGPSGSAPSGSPAAGASTSPSTSPFPSRSPMPTGSAATVPEPTPVATPTPRVTPHTINSPDPSFSEVELVCADYLEDCVLHRTNAVGQEPPGWPIPLAGTVLDRRVNDVTIGCGTIQESIVRGGVEDITYVGMDGASGPQLHAINSDGTRRRGWPQPFPAPAGDCHGFMLSPDGERVAAWGYAGVVPDAELVAERTEFTIFDRDGATLAGWPRGSAGAATAPVWLEDGLAYVSATGRLWAHDPAGEVRSGWGDRLASQQLPVSFGPRLAIAQPRAGADDQVVVFELDGSPRPGYPVTIGGEIQDRCLFGDVPCAGLVQPTMGPDGTVYVALGNGGDHEVAESGTAGGRITAFGEDGRLVEGWPVQLPDRTHAIDIGWNSEGAILARAVVCGPGGCGDIEDEGWLWYALDGDWVKDMPGSLQVGP